MKRFVPVVALFLLVMLLAQFQVRAATQAVRVDRYWVSSSAYAMNAQYGANQTEVTVGQVAVHPATQGCVSCGPIIAYGTRIYLDSRGDPPGYVDIPGSGGTPTRYTSFIVNDVGDIWWSGFPTQPYWIDIYFGRWRRSGENCYCGGTQNFCILGSTNSCDNANGYGIHSGGWYYYYQ